MIKRFLLIIAILLLIPTISAQNGDQYHLKILAVQENFVQEYEGSDADLYLELKEGSGRVFLETYPLTKTDTQISTRFAKDIACNYYDLNCEKYDFIYTIKAKSNIIGGPSAGAAMAVLTVIAMQDLEYDESVTITGTINSGGIIGPVGGVKEKMEAASNIGLKKVLIAKGSKSHKIPINNSNDTEILDLIEYGKNNLSLQVVEVLDLDDVLFEFTGKRFNVKNISVEENEEYTKIMRGLQNVLCKRTNDIENDLRKDKIILNVSFQNDINSRIESAQNATKTGDFYSAASFCFGANIELKSHFYREKNLSPGMTRVIFNNLDRKTHLLEQKIQDEQIDTISDLQTFMVVKERLSDVKEQIRKFMEDDYENQDELYRIAGYAEERFFSALSWMQFFSMDGKKFVLNKEILQKSCIQKLSEADERIQYASVYVGEHRVQNIRDSMNLARKAMNETEYELCLIKATQTKADANALLSSLGLFEDNIDEFLDGKNTAVKRVISRNSQEGIFPILGYSYYIYADSLKESDKFTSLVYLEYALEMSNLEIYFPEEKSFREVDFELDEKWIYFIIGILVGLGISFWFKKR